ncbi:hypothetical protein CCP4SC76_1800028 [Gammaproteobacteria bacterium]
MDYLPTLHSSVHIFGIVSEVKSAYTHNNRTTPVKAISATLINSNKFLMEKSMEGYGEHPTRSIRHFLRQEHKLKVGNISAIDN